jgi:ankyrin repeat protein
MVERLLSAGGDANAPLLSGETVLMTCARSGDARAVKALLARGADVNAREREHRQTALMWAAAERHPDVVRLLVEARADIRARSLVYPQTVVGEQTQRAGREELNYTVLRGGATPLLFAARAGDEESARLLLEGGADANDSQPDGVSALVLAAHSGHGRVAAMLLAKGADPDAAGGGYRRSMRRSSEAIWIWRRRSSRAAPTRISASRRGRRCGATPPTGTCRRRSSDRRRTCWRPGSSKPTSCRCSSPAAPTRA